MTTPGTFKSKKATSIYCTLLVLGLTSFMAPTAQAAESSNQNPERTDTEVPSKKAGFETIRNLDYTIILCDDLTAMREFYTSVLGFEIDHETPGAWVALRVGSSLLTLRPRNRPYDGPKPPKESASLQLAFRVPPKDVDQAHATLVRIGIPVIDPPKDQPWGHRTLFFADPEHNVIEIYADI